MMEHSKIPDDQVAGSGTPPTDTGALPSGQPVTTTIQQETPPTFTRTETKVGETTLIQLTPSKEWVREAREMVAARNRDLAEERRATLLEACHRYGLQGVHPVCDLFPLMSEDAIKDLCKDIRQNGLVNPVVVHEGLLLDGRNRLLICEWEEVKPQVIEWRQIYKGPMSVSQWLFSINAQRRHLTVDQITAVRLAICEWEKEQEAAQQRQKAGVNADGSAGGRGRKKNLPINRSEGLLPDGSTQTAPASKKDRSCETRAKVAKEIGVSERKVQQAMNLQKTDPALLKQVAQGSIGLSEAEKRTKTARQAKTDKTPKGKAQSKAAAGKPVAKGKAAKDGAYIAKIVTDMMSRIVRTLTAHPDINDELIVGLVSKVAGTYPDVVIQGLTKESRK